MKTSEQRIEHILRRMLADRSTDAPADSIKWTKDLFRARSVEQPAGLVRRIMAVITSDLAPGMAAFGERSGAAGQARQMLFEAGENAVDLRLTAVKKGYEIRGQILGEGFENAGIEMSNNLANIKAKAGRMAAFSLTGVPAGEYTLSIRGEGAEIIIERLTLK